MDTLMLNIGQAVQKYNLIRLVCVSFWFICNLGFVRAVQPELISKFNIAKCENVAQRLQGWEIKHFEPPQTQVERKQNYWY